jgi:ABC-type branched-subunit amino acid transport system substrate-binding protein
MLLAAMTALAPAREAAMPGVTPEEIVLGTHAPLSGPATPYSALARAAEAYFRWVNDQGGVNGRRIRLLIRDGGLNPAAGERAVRELVRRDRVLAVIGAIGDRPHAPAVDFLNDAEVPDLFVTGGSLALSRPLRRWTVALQPSHWQEGMLLAQIALRELGGRRVAIYAQSTEMGSELARGFREGVRGRLAVAAEAQQAVTEGDPGEALSALRASGAQSVALFAVPGMAARFIAAARARGWAPQFLLPSVCAGGELFAWAGRGNVEGAISLGYLPLGDDPRNPLVARHRELLARYAPELKAHPLTIAGQAIAELTVEALRRAGDPPTRAALLEAVESLDNWNDEGRALVPAVTLSAQDHQALHAARMLVAREGHWVAVGEWLVAPPPPAR